MFQEQKIKNTNSQQLGKFEHNQNPDPNGKSKNASITDIELPSEISSTITHLYDSAESLASKSHSYLASFLDKNSKVAHEQLQAFFEPLRNSINDYLKDVDVKKAQQDFYTYADRSFKEIAKQAETTRKEILEFIKSDAAQSDADSYVGYMKSALKTTYKTCAYCASSFRDTLAPYVNYVGTTVLGKDTYEWISNSISERFLLAQEYLQKLADYLFDTQGEDSYKVKNEMEKTTQSSIAPLTLLDTAREMIENIDELIQSTASYFGDKKEDFLSHRITDTHEDGIREKQPVVVRQELLGDLVRNPADPFPSFEDRQKDQREMDQKRKYEELQIAKNSSSFVRTGIDGEMSAVDKLEVSLNGKVG